MWHFLKQIGEVDLSFLFKIKMGCIPYTLKPAIGDLTSLSSLSWAEIG